jgi:hypothetical protein
VGKIVKIQFDMPEDKFNYIKKLAESNGVMSRKELFNSALAILEWAILERKEGRIVASIDRNEKKIREIVMPILSGVPVENEALA